MTIIPMRGLLLPIWKWALVLLLLPILVLYMGALILFARTAHSCELYFSKKV